MGSFFRSGRFRFFIAALGIIILGTALAAVSQNGASPASIAAGTVFMPLRKVSSALANAIDDFSIHFRSSSTYQKKVAELESEIEGYRAQLIDYEQTKQKLKTYEEFLELKEEHDDYKFAEASVIGSDKTDFFGTFTLNRGTMDGVKVNNPVIFGKNLVGVVVKGAPTYCVVNTILNPKTYVSAGEVRTRETGYVDTTAELSKLKQCRLSGLQRTTSVSPGGIVTTTGTGGIYPADLIIGDVEEVKNDTATISSYAVIQPQIDFEELRDVFVIIDFRGMGVTN